MNSRDCLGTRVLVYAFAPCHPQSRLAEVRLPDAPFPRDARTWWSGVLCRD
jgi:hypothetical protein